MLTVYLSKSTTLLVLLSLCQVNSFVCNAAQVFSADTTQPTANFCLQGIPFKLQVSLSVSFSHFFSLSLFRSLSARSVKRIRRQSGKRRLTDLRPQLLIYSTHTTLPSPPLPSVQVNPSAFSCCYCCCSVFIQRLSVYCARVFTAISIYKATTKAATEILSSKCTETQSIYYVYTYMLYMHTYIHIYISICTYICIHSCV